MVTRKKLLKIVAPIISWSHPFLLSAHIELSYKTVFMVLLPLKIEIILFSSWVYQFQLCCPCRTGAVFYFLGN